MTAAAAPPPRLSVVVLAYDEERNLRPAVEEILAELRASASSWELILVDDGSTDRTGHVADEIAASTESVRVIHHGENRGLGGGYRTGFDEARGELLTFFPADGQFPPEIIGVFLARMNAFDMVLGYLPRRQSSLVAKGLSFVERLAYRALLGPFPRFQGIVMFRRSLLGEIPLRSTGRGWAIIMELVLRAGRGPYRVVSVPTASRPRMSGRSKVQNLRAIRDNLRQLLALRALRPR